MLRRHYKKKSSGFKQWEQKEHAEDYLVFPDNIGEHLSIDEVALSKGELYTFITNKNGRGKRGSLVASVKGTLSANIIQVLEKIPLEQRNKVKEVTLDMAKNMESSARTCFPMANLVTDRFHVVRLALEALQHIRVNQRWVELDMENKAIEAAKKNGVRYKAPLLPNGDTPKQLLARCRYVFAKKKADWTQSQEQRANIAFENYPDLKKAYDHVLEFRLIYESNTKISAEKKFNEWINKTHEMEIKEFLTVANTVSNHMSNILNFFDNRSTNANAESFNSKIKLFRANLRGVVDTRFFLFRLSKLFA
ncbi:transposase [Cytophagaceae bacterium ABcell3]|nr:transposase [Cytophagaceae bacterium ABcell3]WMJ72059.1 transposase [Cytophagaceae bacterium ABcell3]WMJ72198.1 transposase [Cytophagaceae bacterium ABcell3]WMJ72875.1 transposase [Cytophagaceae bacterium ABcell3]WMJ73502.1 transposase [Cytophagaceae bacterium ABcell3]